MAQSPGLIQLQPNTPTDQQTQLINDNFHTLANLLQTNSFIIVGAGEAQTPSLTLVDGGAGIWSGAGASTSVAHNLTVPPQIIAYLNFSGSGYLPIPWTSVTSPGSTQVVIASYYVQVDSINVNIQVDATSLHSATTLAPLNVKYFLIQQTAN